MTKNRLSTLDLYDYFKDTHHNRVIPSCCFPERHVLCSESGRALPPLLHELITLRIFCAGFGRNRGVCGNFRLKSVPCVMFNSFQPVEKGPPAVEKSESLLSRRFLQTDADNNLFTAEATFDGLRVVSRVELQRS